MTRKMALAGLLLAMFALSGSVYLMGPLGRLQGRPLVIVLVTWTAVLALVTFYVLRLRRRLHMVVDRFGGGGWVASVFTQLAPFMLLGGWLLPFGALVLGAWLEG